MVNSINIIFYIQNGNEEGLKKMIYSIVSQEIKYETTWIVYGQLSDDIKESFLEKKEVCFVDYSGDLKKDYEALVSNLTGDYFTIITDNDEWTDEHYLQRAIEVLEEESQFSMYGANVCDKTTQECTYDLYSVHCEGLFDLWYQKYINYGVDDFFYHLVLNRDMQACIIPQAIIYRNYPKAYEQLFDHLEEIVLETIFIGKLFYFVNLKYGMSVLTQEIVCYGVIDTVPKWKRHMVYAFMVYAIKDIYEERNPRWISEYVNLEFYFCIKAMREDITKNLKLSEKEMRQLEFLKYVSEQLPKGSPFVIKCFGENNPEKIFLVLEFERRGLGFFATVFQMLGAFSYAEKNNLIPVVDFKNHYVRGFQSSKKRFVENSWEYYFEQPVAGVNLDKVYTSKNVICCDEYGWCNPNWYDMLPTNGDMVSEWNEIIHKYLRPKWEIQDYIDRSYNKIFGAKENILGISMRAGYIRCHKKDGDLILEHPVQLELEEMIRLIEQYMRKWKCEWVFLVVDDDFYFQKIRDAFKEKCLYLERNRYHYFCDKDSMADIKQITNSVLEHGIVEHNTEYLCETYLLARCDSLLAGNCGCSRMAYFLNNNQYEHVEIIDKGKY